MKRLIPRYPNPGAPSSPGPLCTPRLARQEPRGVGRNRAPRGRLAPTNPAARPPRPSGPGLCGQAVGLGEPRAGCPVRAGLTAGRAARPARLGRGLREVKAHEKGRKGAWRTKDGPPSLRIKGLSEEGTASGREGHGEGQGPGAGPTGALGKDGVRRAVAGNGPARRAMGDHGRQPLAIVLFSVFLSVGGPP